MSISIGFILDAAIIVLLGITIFYAFRLTIFLKTFRDGREDIQRLFIDLTNHIDRAEKSMQVMRDTADQSGTNLQKIVHDAKALSDELRFMNEAGDSLAGRLEKLASRNKELVDLLQKSGGIGPSDLPRENAVPPAKSKRASMPEDRPLPEFLINDRDFFEEEDESQGRSHFLETVEDTYEWEEEDDDRFAEDEEVDFASEAEREFYRSIKQAQRKKAGGVI